MSSILSRKSLRIKWVKSKVTLIRGNLNNNCDVDTKNKSAQTR